MPQFARTRAAGSRAPARREPAAFRAFVTLLAFIPPAREPDPMNGALNVANPHLASPARAVHHRRAPSPDGQEAQHPQHVRHRARRSRTFPARAEPSPDDRFTGKAIRRNARRVWVVVSSGECASGARGSPAVMSVERRPPRIRASARPSPRIAIRAYTLCAPDAALLPPPPPQPIRLVLFAPRGRSESARRDNTSQFYYPLSAATTE